jgi:hypothetical protein
MFTYQLDVDYVEGEGAHATPPRRTWVSVMAETDNDAELCALEMVACTGRTPVRVAIDWDNF